MCGTGDPFIFVGTNFCELWQTIHVYVILWFGKDYIQLDSKFVI